MSRTDCKSSFICWSCMVSLSRTGLYSSMARRKTMPSLTRLSRPPPSGGCWGGQLGLRGSLGKAGKHPFLRYRSPGSDIHQCFWLPVCHVVPALLWKDHSTVGCAAWACWCDMEVLKLLFWAVQRCSACLGEQLHIYCRSGFQSEGLR